MHKSKFLALLLAVAMVVSMIVVPVYADSAVTYTVSANKTTYAPGETVVVTLEMTANPGFAAGGVEVIAKGLTLKSAEPLWEEEATKPTYGPEGVARAIFSSPETFTAMGEIARYTYTAPTETGDYTITVAEVNDVDNNVYGDHADINNNDVATAFVNATITVSKDACPEHGDVEWTLVNEDVWGNGTAIVGGTGSEVKHYKLDADITLDAIKASVANTMVVNGNVCIDLNGHTITALREQDNTGADNVGTRVFNVMNGANLTVMDSATGGAITGGMARGNMGNSTNKGAGSDLDCRGGNIYVENGATFTLVSGTVTGGYTLAGSINVNSQGGNIYGEAGSTINIKGGTVSNGSVNGQVGARGYLYAGNQKGGGNIATDGTLNITGGTITGGRVYGENSGTSAMVNMYGGNIMMQGGSLNIENATISNGSADVKFAYKSGNNKAASGASGGNIYTQDVANITVKDSTITGGTLTLDTVDTVTTTTAYIEVLGGNMAIRNGDLTVTGASKITGGQINFDSSMKTSHTTTTSVVKGANIYISGGDVVLKDTTELSGSKLWNHVANAGLANAAWAAGANVYAENGGTAAAPGKITAANTVIADGEGGYDCNYALHAKDHYVVNVYGAKIGTIGLGSTENDKINVFDGTIRIALTTYSSVTRYPTSDGHCCYIPSDDSKVRVVWHTNLPENGYCATCDYTYTSPTVGSHTYAETAAGSGKYACSSCGHKLTCLTCGDKDDITWTEFSTRPDRDVEAGHYFMNADETYNSLQINIAKNTHVCLDMNGHTFTHTQARTAFANNAGALLIIQGGGTIQNTAAAAASASVVSSSGNLKMYGITVKGGHQTTNGGNMSLYGGTLYMENCTLEGGQVDVSGGNMYISTGSAELVNCVIKDGKAVGHGGNVAIINGQATFTDCTITGGQGVRGGNLRLQGSGTGAEVVISGGIVSDGVATEYGGNIGVQYGYGKAVNALTIKDGAVITGGTALHGGNIEGVYTYIDLQDCTITDGTATSGYGGNINIRGLANTGEAKLNIGAGATISGGKVNGVPYDVELGGAAGDKYTIQSGADVGYVTVTNPDPTTVTVEAGVKSGNELSTLSKLPSVLADGVYTTYADLDAAIAAGQGQTVLLGADATFEDDTLRDFGCTLDINGKNVTASQIVVSDSQSKLIDSKESGLLVVPSNNFGLCSDNGYVPVAVDGGYRLETVELVQKIDVISDDQVKLKFKFQDKAADTMLDTLLASGQGDIRVTLTWNGGEIEKKYDVNWLQAYAGNDGAAWGTKMFTCYVSGVEGVEGLTITASIYSEGVQVYAETV